MDCQIDPLKTNILRKGNNLSNIVCLDVVVEIDFEMTYTLILEETLGQHSS